MKKDLPYKAFGELLVQLRVKAGLAQQSDLAALLKTSQQTVSRWELGASRPRDKQMPLVASALQGNLDHLLAAAGYTAKAVIAAFDHPFPIDALNPDSFERFCFYLLSQLYPKAVVHRAGSQGHTQYGLDIEILFSDNTCHTFQCKRTDDFGPRKVKAAIAAHTRESTKKIILLTRIASPQARQTVRESPDWDIWDKEDISRIIRQELSKDQQLRIVDTFFHGQRLALLGETEAGPWQTTEEFFAAFMNGRGAFSHTWELVGRTDEVQDIVEHLADRTVPAIFLIGAGGSGKSRILKQVIDIYEAAHPGLLVRFLSPTEDVTNKSLEDLGRNKKVLVIDDAHERNDLPLLFQYASAPANEAIVLLSFRPYGLDYIKAQASNFALADSRIFEKKFEPLKLEQATQLATQVLKEYDGPVNAAKDIARLTLDCPLATVIGAQVVAKEKIHLELAKNENTFRSTLFGKFEQIIAGNIGNKNDSEPITKLLKVLSLIQPFHPEDESVMQLAERVEGLRISDTNRLIRLLTDAGVLFKRGGRYRLSPDLLADFIIERTCIGESGKSTGYAELVFDAANNTQVEHLLVNLGKLDWRRANGDPSNSTLLDGVWGKLKPSSEYYDPHISAVTAVAYYQPRRTLAFAEHLISEGTHLRDLPNLIKYAAYNIDHLLKACECLWELGKEDNRSLNQHPGHAIRVLTELCEVEQNKSIEYNEIVVDFGLSLLEKENSWGHKYTPFDVLKGILLTEGQITTSNGRSIVFGGFLISPRFVSALRKKVIDAAINLLSHSNAKRAVLAARFLQEGLRYPMGVFNLQVPSEARSEWTSEFVKTLEDIEQAAQSNKFDPLVLIEIARSVSWHANFAEEETTPIAKRLTAALPQSLDFRTILALVDGNGIVIGRMDLEQRQREWERQLDILTSDILSTYKDGKEQRAYIEKQIIHIAQNNATEITSSYVLYRRLIARSDSLANATVSYALEKPEAQTTQFAGIALSKLLNEDRRLGCDIARQFLETGSRELHAAVGDAYSGLYINEKGYEKEDLAIVKEILSSKDRWVVSNAISAARTVATKNQLIAIDLLKSVDFSISEKIADDVVQLFHQGGSIPFNLLTEEDIQYFLTQLMLLNELNGYWIETFLSTVSKYYPIVAASFFMNRVDHAAATQNWQYRPCNFGPYCNVPLLFRQSKEFGVLLRQVSQWMKLRIGDDYLFQHRAAELFDMMFCPFDNDVLGFIQDWIDESTPADMKLISHILGETPPNFVFEHRAFVLRFLDRAKQLGKTVLDDAMSVLYRSATSGIRSGIPGEPFPRDVRMKEEAEKALQNLSRFTPGYKLYESIQKHAEFDIKRSLKEGEAFED